MRNISTAILLFAAGASAQAIQLADGRILAGDIEQVTGDGFTFTRVDTGGVLQLRWEHLAAESASEVKKLFDISVEDEGELLVDAQVIRWATPSGLLREEVGRRADSDGTTINLRAKGNTVAIPRKALRSLGTRRVPVSAIYTREEFYQEKLSEFAPGDDADRHILLADVLVRVGDYEHAEQHLKRAQELGNSKQPQVLSAKLAKVALYKSAAGERGLLDQIKASRGRKDFHRGAELIAEFEKKYAAGKLAAEFSAEKERFAQARQRYFTGRVAEGWYGLITSIARAKAVESGSTYASAREYAEGQMGKEIRKRLGERLRLAEDEVSALWSERITSKVVSRTELFAYGVGSWTLGKDRIMKDTQQGKSEQEPGNAQATEEQQAAERQARKIREYLDRLKQAQQTAGNANAKEETEEDWWKGASPEERTNFLKAHYAENSGDLEVVTAHLTPCVTCLGQGFLEVLGTQGGKSTKLDCPTCKGTAYKRWLRAR